MPSIGNVEIKITAEDLQNELLSADFSKLLADTAKHIVEMQTAALFTVPAMRRFAGALSGLGQLESTADLTRVTYDVDRDAPSPRRAIALDGKI